MRQKLITTLLAAVATTVAVGALGVATASAGTTVPFASGSDWTAFSADPGLTPFLQTPNILGPAQRVCMSEVAPPTCAPAP